jgi:hypothetical protein
MSSLPMLNFGARSPVSAKQLLWACEGIVPREEAEILRLILSGESHKCPASNPAIIAWNSFDTSLRNELVRIRAARRRVDASKYLREGGEYDTSIAHTAINAFRAANPMESERMLDSERWRFLDGLSTGHYFDTEALTVYALKLYILEKWDRIESSDRQALLKEALAVNPVRN